MIDIDPESARFTAARACADAILHRGIERDDDLEFLRLGGWHASTSSAPGRKRNLSSMPSSFQTVTSLPRCLEAKRHRQGAAERIAIGTHVAHDDEALPRAEHVGDLGKAAVGFHGIHRVGHGLGMRA